MFERITEESFDAVFPLLEEAFPITELRTEAGQRSLLQEEQYRLYGVKKGGRFAAVLAVWDFLDFVYIEHFAVKKEERSGGFGGLVLDAFAAEMKKPLVLEVEEPTDALTRRRIGFYQRHGLVYNPYFYLQPPLREGNQPLPLKLMTKPNGISEDTFRRYQKELYRVVYKYAEK